MLGTEVSVLTCVLLKYKKKKSSHQLVTWHGNDTGINKNIITVFHNQQWKISDISRHVLCANRTYWTQSTSKSLLTQQMHFNNDINRKPPQSCHAHQRIRTNLCYLDLCHHPRHVLWVLGHTCFFVKKWSMQGMGITTIFKKCQGLTLTNNIPGVRWYIHPILRWTPLTTANKWSEWWSYRSLASSDTFIKAATSISGVGIRFCHFSKTEMQTLLWKWRHHAKRIVEKWLF